MDAAEFTTLLQKRNIDAEALRQRLPEIHARWQSLAAQLHTESFLAQVRFEINAVRRALQDQAHLPLRHNEPKPL